MNDITRRRDTLNLGHTSVAKTSSETWQENVFYVRMYICEKLIKETTNKKNKSEVSLEVLPNNNNCNNNKTSFHNGLRRKNG